MTYHDKINKYLGFKKINHKKKTNLSDEFLNRIDQIIEYQSLDKNDLKEIIKKNHHLSNDKIEQLLKNYPPQIGARKLIKEAYQLEKIK